MSLLLDALIGFCNVSTICLSSFNKIPQIRTILKAQSVAGLSLAALMLELTSYCISLSYNIYSGYSLASYFEYPLLVIQDIVMLVIFLSLTNRLSPILLVPASIYATAVYLIISGTLPHAVIVTLVGLTTPISASSKIMALLTIVRVKDSSTVSLGSYGISLYTCLTRLLTIYVESADPALLFNFGTSTLLNALIILAAIAYKPKEKPEEKKE